MRHSSALTSEPLTRCRCAASNMLIITLPQVSSSSSVRTWRGAASTHPHPLPALAHPHARTSVHDPRAASTKPSPPCASPTTAAVAGGGGDGGCRPVPSCRRRRRRLRHLGPPSYCAIRQRILRARAHGSPGALVSAAAGVRVSCVSAAPRGAAGAARARGAHARPAALMRAACECRGAFALRLARKNDARPHATHATARSAESTRRGPGRPRRAARGLGRGPGLVVTHEATRTPRESDPLQPLPAAPPRGISSVLDHLHGNAHRGASRSRDALSIPHAPTAAAASSRRAGRPGVKSGSDVGTAAMVTHVVCERVRPVG